MAPPPGVAARWPGSVVLGRVFADRRTADRNPGDLRTHSVWL